MAPQRTHGLASRRAADWAAASVFVVLLVLGATLLIAVGLDPPPSKTESRTSTMEIETSGKTTTRTETTEINTADVSLSVWERLLGRNLGVLIGIAVVFLGAFIGGGAVQRVLLGEFAFKLGPLEVPHIGLAEVASAVQTAQISLATGPSPATDSAISPAARPDLASRSGWIDSKDPNLVLVGWRLDLEAQLRELAREHHIDDNLQGGNQLLYKLREAGVLSTSAVEGLRRLIELADQAAHGADVDPDVVNILHTSGKDILEQLRRQFQ